MPLARQQPMRNPLRWRPLTTTSDSQGSTTTFHYNYFRDYNPKTGKYIESDPIGLKGGINTFAYATSNPITGFDLDGLDVTIEISNRSYSSTGQSVNGNISVTSDVATAGNFSGFTLENAKPGNGTKLPVSPGTYDGFVRKDHSPNRIELKNVPNFKNVQIHNGSYPIDFKGCFGAGTTQNTDFLGNTKNSMNKINDIIKADGTGNITIIVGPTHVGH